jgi:hypothetical protein
VAWRQDKRQPIARAITNTQAARWAGHSNSPDENKHTNAGKHTHARTEANTAAEEEANA